MANTLYVNKASPWENDCVESFNGNLRDELLNRELFLSPAEFRYVLNGWRLDYSHHRSHSSLDWQVPAAFAAKFKDRKGQFVGAFLAASPADPPVGAASLLLDLPAQSTQILSQRLVHKTRGGSHIEPGSISNVPSNFQGHLPTTCAVAGSTLHPGAMVAISCLPSPGTSLPYGASISTGNMPPSRRCARGSGRPCG